MKKMKFNTLNKSNERRKNAGFVQPRIYLFLELTSLYMLGYILTFGFSLGYLNMLIILSVIIFVITSSLPRYNKAISRAKNKNVEKRYTDKY